jgi:DNA topoisomerase IB
LLRALPAIRASVQRDLTLVELPRATVLATVVRLLESTHIRVGILKPFAANVTAIRRLSRHIHPARSAAMRALAACVPLLLDQNYLLKKRRSSLF